MTVILGCSSGEGYGDDGANANAEADELTATANVMIFALGTTKT